MQSFSTTCNNRSWSASLWQCNWCLLVFFMTSAAGQFSHTVLVHQSHVLGRGGWRYGTYLSSLSYSQEATRGNKSVRASSTHTLLSVLLTNPPLSLCSCCSWWRSSVPAWTRAVDSSSGDRCACGACEVRGRWVWPADWQTGGGGSAAVYRKRQIICPGYPTCSWKVVYLPLYFLYVSLW